MLKKTTLLLTALCIAPSAMAARDVTAFPFRENFDTDAYTRDIVRLTQGARHEWEPDGGWRGGAAKFFPPTQNEGYSGLGSFTRIYQNHGRVTQLNLRVLAYHGPTLTPLGPKNSKLMILNPASGTRPMILKNGRFYPNGEEYGFYGACLSTVCTWHDDGNSGAPRPGTGFQYGNPGTDDNYTNQWVSIELEANTVANTVKTFIHTADGRITGLQAQRTDYNDADYFTHVDGVPGYWGNRSDGWPRRLDSGSYIMIDELELNTRYIGPPAGFVGGSSGSGPDAPPAAPSNLR